MTPSDLHERLDRGHPPLPDPHFDGFYVGVHILVINYRNQSGGLVCEVPGFDGALVKDEHRYLPR